MNEKTIAKSFERLPKEIQTYGKLEAIIYYHGKLQDELINEKDSKKYPKIKRVKGFR